MPNKIVFVQGSPRKNGNTRAMTNIAVSSAKKFGAKVDVIDATELDFKAPGCIGCRKCQQKEAYGCTLNDGVAQAVATLPDYDVIVLATPLFWWSYSAQIKIFVDRMFSLSKVTEKNYRSLLAGKTLGLLATSGGPIENNLDILVKQWATPASFFQSPFISCLFPETPPDPDILIQDAAAVSKAEKFGKTLASD